MQKAVVYLESRVTGFPENKDMKHEDIQRNVVAAMVKFGQDCAKAALEVAYEGIERSPLINQLNSNGREKLRGYILDSFALNQIQ